VQVAHQVEVLEVWSVVEAVCAVTVGHDVHGLLEPLWSDVRNDSQIL
jgi:hypothetical protein